MSGKDEKIDLHDYLPPLPAWYRPMKWMIPMGAAVVTMLLTSLFITGLLPLPGILSLLNWLPTAYETLEGLGAATFFGLSVSSAGILTAVFTNFMFRLAAFSSLETVVYEHELNYKQLEKTISALEDKKSRLSQKNKELQRALFNAEVDAEKAEGRSKPIIFSENDACNQSRTSVSDKDKASCETNNNNNNTNKENECADDKSATSRKPANRSNKRS